MTKQDLKNLTNATFVALIDLKFAKMDMKGAITLKGRFLDGYAYPVPYTERELKAKRLLAECDYAKRKMIFVELWKACRRAQKLT